jgi:hypothetical protein
LVLNYLVHMRSHWVYYYAVCAFTIFLASMHLLQEGQMGWKVLSNNITPAF